MAIDWQVCRVLHPGLILEVLGRLGIRITVDDSPELMFKLGFFGGSDDLMSEFVVEFKVLGKLCECFDGILLMFFLKGFPQGELVNLLNSGRNKVFTIPEAKRRLPLPTCLQFDCTVLSILLLKLG